MKNSTLHLSNFLGSHLSKNEFRRQLGLGPSSMGDEEWVWDCQAVLEFSNLGENSYSPISVLSMVRRFHLLDWVGRDRTNELYKFCQSHESDLLDRPEVLATIISQIFHVHHEWRKSLENLTRSHPETDPEEKDLLLLRAIRSMGFHPKDLYLSEAAKSVMEVLKFSSSHSVFEFCLATDFMAKPQPGMQEQFLELLKVSEFDAAATSLQNHWRLSEPLLDGNTVMSQLKTLGPIQKEEALFAVQLAEVLSDEMTLITSELLQLFSGMPIVKQA